MVDQFYFFQRKKLSLLNKSNGESTGVLSSTLPSFKHLCEKNLGTKMMRRLIRIRNDNWCLHIYYKKRSNGMPEALFIGFHFIRFISFIHSFIHLFIHSLTHSFIHSFIHSSIHPFIHSAIQSFSHSAIQPFIHSSIHPFLHSFIHPFIHSFIYLFIYLSIEGPMLIIIFVTEMVIMHKCLRQCKPSQCHQTMIYRLTLFLLLYQKHLLYAHFLNL